ncbi:LytR/AlgR family response regulator transcription factor [Foetidibacter luteolus]|uniref:LytR/AlgR family response regulator transcription factor n=1 Tax=Foetidibacter luteolus TaxID=2608880 RepID=UPI00129B4CF1|nr:response regulator transcription factor [Foetidibacter luteolus]
MTCVAIDDEPLALQLVQSYIGKTEGLELVAKFTDTVEAGEFMENNPVDLLFLDVQMPDESGLQFFSRLKNKPMVIFTTAFSQFAVEGFNLDAIDYLLKPFDYDRFAKAVNKAMEFAQFRQDKAVAEGFLFVKHNYQWAKIYYKDIELIEALDDYIKIYIQPKPILVHMSMKAVSEKLPAEKFIRAHRSYIVPVDRINSWNKNIIRIGDKSIPISYTYQKQVYELLQKKMEM